MNFIWDTETSGLFPRGANYKKLEDFNNARLVSICWLITQGDNIVEQAYYVIKPDGFIISDESIAIHGITNEYANENGVNIKDVLTQFSIGLKRCANMVAHNIEFDLNIIKSELHRYGFKESIEDIKSRHHICTMKKGRMFMKVRKYPKLGELYKFLYNIDITNAHSALHDTINCYKCFIKLFPSDPSVFYFADKQVKLTDEQQKVTFEEIDKNMLVIAGAGSGKSSTLLTRIKYLLDKGVSESSIILTTFTRNAANDMKEKLFDIMGYKSEIIVGTIDSLSKYYLSTSYDSTNDMRVDEYAPKFLEMIQKRPSFFSPFKYLFVDEIQDINDLQFAIINEFYKNNVYIIGVGDSSQNIYEFRGSNIKYIINFTKYFKNSVVHKLTNNFRSTKEIIELANASIRYNSNRVAIDMFAANEKLLAENLGKPVIKFCSSVTNQYVYVMNKIKNYLAKGIKENAICIMSPINKPLEDMFNMLIENNINSYYYRSNDDSNVVKMEGKVNLNTIHKSKGLEWSIVFLIGMNDEQNKNIYKYNRDDKLKCAKMIEANRRLFYVAITRAKRELYILTDNRSEITRFVNEVNSDLYI